MNADGIAREMLAGFTQGCIVAGDCRGVCDGICKSRLEAISTALRQAYLSGKQAGREEAAEAIRAAGPKEGPLHLVTEGFVEAIRTLGDADVADA